VSEIRKHRLLLVSNRLPVTVRFEKGEFVLDRSSGGLASGLATAHDEGDSLWIGWPGEVHTTNATLRRSLDDALAALRIVPIYLNRLEAKGFYEDVSNGVLWPVLHYRIDQMPYHPTGWETFQHVSEAFANAIIDAYQPGDVIWVHDYHLVLVPGLVRKALPEARIGFFLHIPFPAPDVFAVVPWRQEILESLLAADLLGFHVAEYAEHFREACRRLLGAKVSGEHVSLGGHRARATAFALGIDTRFWNDLVSRLEVTLRAEEIRREAPRRKILVGIDRLDYTKGLLRRLTAIELLFREDPSLAERVRLIQVVFPSREAIESYSSLRRRIDEQVGRINGRYGSTADAPIRLLSRNLSVEDTASLYEAADVMLVTPLRDGMNLVAKEFIACRTREDGVLVLSEFAGATGELEGAVLVNPYNVEEMAERIRLALTMPAAEQRERMLSLRSRVMGSDVRLWTQAFVQALEAETESSGARDRAEHAEPDSSFIPSVG
jgi:trehalose 6-phosphate synthase/phosphatase